MIVVTAGLTYIDIDAYGGCIAYAELLCAQGKEAVAASTAQKNERISSPVRGWQASMRSDYVPGPEDVFTLIDVSDPDYFDRMVDLTRIDEIIDHHPGYEQYWRERIDNRADIEVIGAACTMVYERWLAAGMLDQMSKVSARILMCGILDNTLNFQADITTQRDIDAYDALAKIADLPTDWAAEYFSECQESILHDPVKALQNDTKTTIYKTYGDQIIHVGQLVLWDAHILLEDHIQALCHELSKSNPEWFMNIVSVGERCSYFIADNQDVRTWLSGLLGVTCNGRIAKADRLWLRKEIARADINQAV